MSLVKLSAVTFVFVKTWTRLNSAPHAVDYHRITVNELMLVNEGGRA